MATKKKSFEESLQQLDKLVKQLENGDAPLEDALKYFEEGMALSAFCRKTLNTAEETVMTIMRENGLSDAQEVK
ncbi:exodeoxyribonuclease VII small subunit [Carnobacteriaceae bacterium zg-ZUI252]|nr:exodeoxyribonuclease VII small subunit [Carnobacteriaceae bacterium zg-ZUI252]MBS4770580.1 exodeoxyribonuclease VII small subunit [Carnobacteriaceae bacterium zg-ZUI240]QTU83498.1 exodeoxyribonuclease VII small subunit [Carnobacteriaceae bacterium zg-C25]